MNIDNHYILSINSLFTNIALHHLTQDTNFVVGKKDIQVIKLVLLFDLLLLAGKQLHKVEQYSCECYIFHSPLIV